MQKKAESSNCWEAAAEAFHQLGIIAHERRDFANAKAWYKKALAIDEKQGNENDIAGTYHQLGMIAQDQRDFADAKAWYKKSLAISEKHGDEHGAALTYHQLGVIAQKQLDFPQAGDFYLKSIEIFANANDTHRLMIAIDNYAHLMHTVTDTEHSQLKQAWLGSH